MNVRYVNYTIQPNGTYTFRHNDGKITTINRAFWLTPDLRVEREHWFDGIANPDLQYQGIEDVRIFAGENGGVQFMGTAQDPDTKKLRIGYGNYSTSSATLTPSIYESPEGRECEKNWSAFRDATGAQRILYDWSPLKVIDASGKIVSTNTQVPGFFRHLRGSSNGVPAGNGELWFLTHFVEYSAPRHYYHIIVALDAATLTVKRWSTPFKFNGDPIEFGLGLVVEADRVLMTYSCWDRSATLMVIPRTMLESEFFSA